MRTISLQRAGETSLTRVMDFKQVPVDQHPSWMESGRRLGHVRRWFGCAVGMPEFLSVAFREKNPHSQELPTILTPATAVVIARRLLLTAHLH